MRILLSVLILIFSLQSLSNADDIGDFEIEGMSLGESLLDYFSEEEINSSIRDYGYPYGFYASGFQKDWFETYQVIDVHLKTNDTKYKIYSLDAMIFYSDIDDCYTKMRLIENDLSTQFLNLKKDDQGVRKHSVDESGKSTVKRIQWKFDNGDLFALECYFWSKEIKIKYPNWSNHLRISLTKKQLDDWLSDSLS